MLGNESVGSAPLGGRGERGESKDTGWHRGGLEGTQGQAGGTAEPWAGAPAKGVCRLCFPRLRLWTLPCYSQLCGPDQVT